MNHEEQTGKNFLWGAFSQIITRLLGLAFFVFMSHILLEKGMGQYNFISSFVVFWFIFADFGAGTYLYREWSKGSTPIEKIEYDFNLMFTVKFFTTIIVIIPFLIVNWFNNRDIFIPLLLFFISVFLSLTVGQADAYLASANNFKLSALRQLIEKTIIFVIGGILLFFFPSVAMVFVAMIVAQLFSLVYYFSGRFPFKLHLIINWLRIKELFLKGLPFVFYMIAVSLYSRIDMVMLKYMKGFEAVGWYGTAYKTGDVASIFSVLFLPAIFPVLSRIINSGNNDDYRNFFNRSIRILFSSSLVLSVFFITFSPIIIGWFFPISFAPSILAMRILSLTLIVAALGGLFNNLLIIQNKEKESVKIIIISCLVNIIFNFILIPKYSLYGAAWATVLSGIVYFFLLQRAVTWEKDLSLLKKMAVLSLFNVIVFVVMKILGLTNNIYLGFGNLLMNIFLIWFLGLLNKSDIQMFYLPFKNKFQSVFFNQNEI